MRESEHTDLGVDGACDVLMYKGWINSEAFTEEMDGSAAIGKTDKGDAAILPRSLEDGVDAKACRDSSPTARMDRRGCSLLEFGVAVVLVVERLKLAGVRVEIGQVSETMSA